jgi:hypothetical protein
VNGNRHFAIYYSTNVALLRTKDFDSRMKKLWIMGILYPKVSGTTIQYLMKYDDALNDELYDPGYKRIRNCSDYVRAKWTSFGGMIKGLNVWLTTKEDAFATNINSNTL